MGEPTPANRPIAIGTLALLLVLASCGSSTRLLGDGGDVPQDEGNGEVQDGPDRAETDGDAGSDGVEEASEDAWEPVDAGPYEWREGGTSGIACRRLPASSGALAHAVSGSGSRVAFGLGELDPRPGVTAIVEKVRVHDWATGSARLVDDFDDVPGSLEESRFLVDLSLEGDRLAYSVTYIFDEDHWGVQLRVADLRDGSVRVLAEGNQHPDLPGPRWLPQLERVVLRYPWVVWLQQSAETWMRKLALAMDLDTGRTIELHEVGRGLDLLGATAAWSAFDGEYRIFQTDLLSSRYSAVAGGEALRWETAITRDWIAWLDQRAYPGGDPLVDPYGTQIFGFERATGAERPLVISPAMHGPCLAGEGDWLAWTDARNNPHPMTDEDPFLDVYAMHLPTMTEIRVDSWESYPQRLDVYEATGETRLVLQEEPYIGLYRSRSIWDCNLPVPAAAAGDADADADADVAADADAGGDADAGADADVDAEEDGGTVCPPGMVGVPAGPFVMGSDPDDGEEYWVLLDEQPEHVVRVSQFCIDRTEVTAAQWQACVDDGVCPPLSCAFAEWDSPATCMTWAEAQAYCAWRRGRLPTEAEWEKAARGGCELVAPDTCGPEDERLYPWGDVPPDCEHVAMYICVYDLVPTGSRPAGAGPYGMLDQIGNAGEWVADWYADDAYASCPDPCRDPTGPETGSERVWRGGDFYSGGAWLAKRFYRDPTARWPRMGLRCVVTR